MWSVPQGVVLVLMRHGQTKRNWRVAKARARNKSSDFPVRLPDEDDRLTIEGMGEAVLAARHLKKKLSGQMDLIAYSCNKRTEQTAEFIRREINPLCSFMQIPELSEKFRWMPEGFAYVTPPNISEADIETYRCVVDIAQDFAKSKRGELDPEHKAQLYKLMEKYVPVLFRWRKRQEEYPITLRNYSKFGEDLVNLVLRALGVLLKIWTQLERGARHVVVVGHAKMLVMLRAILEDLTIEEMDKIYSAEGPPFPCNVGMTFYQEHKGLLVRQGEEVVQIPEGLKLMPDRRRLKITVSQLEYQEIMAHIVEVQRPSKRYGPPRRGNGARSGIMDFLRKANPRVNIPYQRRGRR